MRKNRRSGYNSQNCRGGYYPPAKRILGLILAFVLLLSFAPISANAAIVDSGECGTNLTWTLDSNGTLTISGTGEMRTSSFAIEYWNGNDDKIKSIIIQNGVESIARAALWGCENLTNISIGADVGSPDKFDDWFVEQRKLETIDVNKNNPYFSSNNGVLFNKDKTELLMYPAGKKDTSYVVPSSVTTIHNQAFQFCTYLKNITIPNSVNDIGYCAFNKSSLTSVSIPHSVKTISYAAFSQCVNLKNVVIPNSVTDISDSAFSDCTGLANVIIPDSVTSIGDGAFSNCISLTSIFIPSSVTNIDDNAFSIGDSTNGLHGGGYSRLTEISVDVNNKCYTSVDGVLFNKSKTKLIQYPQGKNAISYNVPSGVTSISSFGFTACKYLTNVNIPNSVIEGLYGYTFSKCNSLTNINVDKNNKYYTSVDGILFNKSKTGLIRYPAGKTATSYDIPRGITSVSASAFEECSYIKNVSIPYGVTTIDGYTFSRCSNLKSVFLPSSIENILWCAFSSDIQDIYYSGTEADWGKININLFSDIGNATIHYNYKSTPSEITKVSLVSSRNGVYKFSAEYEATERGKLIAVVYKDGAVSGYTTLNVLPGSSTASVTVNAASGADNAKFFIWDSLENMRPLSDTYNMNL